MVKEKKHSRNCNATYNASEGNYECDGSCPPDPSTPDTETAKLAREACSWNREHDEWRSWHCRTHDSIESATCDKATETLKAALAQSQHRAQELEQSMVEHFQRDHLAGDGPEIDRWKRRAQEAEAGLTAQANISKAVTDLLIAARAEAQALRARLGEAERLLGIDLHGMDPARCAGICPRSHRSIKECPGCIFLAAPSEVAQAKPQSAMTHYHEQDDPCNDGCGKLPPQPWPTQAKPPVEPEQDWKAIHPNVRNWIINILLHPMATGTWSIAAKRGYVLRSEAEHEERKQAARAAINLLAEGTGYALELAAPEPEPPAEVQGETHAFESFAGTATCAVEGCWSPESDRTVHSEVREPGLPKRCSFFSPHGLWPCIGVEGHAGSHCGEPPTPVEWGVREPEPPKGERIAAAAVREGGVVYTGAHHHQIIRYVSAMTGRPVHGEQGFVTDRNRFVNRIEGASVARAAGQTPAHEGSTLFSEQLWSVPDWVFVPGSAPAALPPHGFVASYPFGSPDVPSRWCHATGCGKGLADPIHTPAP